MEEWPKVIRQGPCLTYSICGTSFWSWGYSRRLSVSLWYSDRFLCWRSNSNCRWRKTQIKYGKCLKEATIARIYSECEKGVSERKIITCKSGRGLFMKSVQRLREWGFTNISQLSYWHQTTEQKFQYSVNLITLPSRRVQITRRTRLRFPIYEVYTGGMWSCVIMKDLVDLWEQDSQSSP